MTTTLDPNIIELIQAHCGMEIRRVVRLVGDDIHQAYQLYDGEHFYFLKASINPAYPDIFIKEVAGLSALKDYFPGIVPKVIFAGQCEYRSFLMLEWLEAQIPKTVDWESFGRQLACMHRQPQLYFGFSTDNYIATLIQSNTAALYWDNFFIYQRLLPLAEILVQNDQFFAGDIARIHQLERHISSIFPPERPALLHGDLWSGNCMCIKQGFTLYDPAVYYGHREMDLAMARLFGGFPSSFFSAYEEVYPLEKDWKERLMLAQLYPILVHAILFGGNYVIEARHILKSYSTE